MRFRPGFSVRLAAVAVVAAWGALLSGQARAYEFVDIATYTTSTTQTVGHACVLYNGTDMSCASTNPYVTSAGLVGIGTSNPTTALEVSGTVSATAFVGNGAGLTGITASVNGGLSGSIVYRDEFGGLHASGGFSISSTTGSVGIGAGAAGWLGNNGLYVTGEGYFGSGLILTDDQILTWGWTAPAAAISGSWATKSLSFITNQAEAMRIVSSGNVGIGTTDPGLARLRVVGASSFPVQAPQLQVADAASSMRLNVGVGSLGGSVSGTWLQSTETGVSNFRNLLMQPYGGSVGVGSLVPQAPLDVSGAIKISGDGTEGCTTTADEGKIRRNPVTGHFQLCAH